MSGSYAARTAPGRSNPTISLGGVFEYPQPQGNELSVATGCKQRFPEGPVRGCGRGAIEVGGKQTVAHGSVARRNTPALRQAPIATIGQQPSPQLGVKGRRKDIVHDNMRKGRRACRRGAWCDTWRRPAWRRGREEEECLRSRRYLCFRCARPLNLTASSSVRHSRPPRLSPAP